MKPCSKNRKWIAWLALGALEARKAAALRDHLARCDGCHRYWKEISNVTERLAAAPPVSHLEASASFHHRVAEKLRAVESRSILENLAAWLRGSMLGWRVAVPALAVVVVVMALLATVARRHHPALSRPGPPTAKVLSASSSDLDLAPTLANYRRIGSQSLEKLSELLTQQGYQRLPPVPVYTILSLEPANAPF